MGIYIYIPYHTDPSWSMNVATHGVANYELPLGINQWRIVILFRNILEGLVDSPTATTATTTTRKRKRGRKRNFDCMLNE